VSISVLYKLVRKYQRHPISTSAQRTLLASLPRTTGRDVFLEMRNCSWAFVVEGLYSWKKEVNAAFLHVK
jgi:hypothetical protein